MAEAVLGSGILCAGIMTANPLQITVPGMVCRPAHAITASVFAGGAGVIRKGNGRPIQPFVTFRVASQKLNTALLI